MYDTKILPLAIYYTKFRTILTVEIYLIVNSVTIVLCDINFYAIYINSRFIRLHIIHCLAYFHIEHSKYFKLIKEIKRNNHNE